MQLDSGGGGSRDVGSGHGKMPASTASASFFGPASLILLLTFLLPSTSGAVLPQSSVDDERQNALVDFRSWDAVAAVVEKARRLIDGDLDGATYGDALYGDGVKGERSIRDMGDHDRKRIFEMAKKVAALELSNARLTNASMKRNKVEDMDKEDKLEALQKQVDANKAQIKQLQKMLAEIIQKVCLFS